MVDVGRHAIEVRKNMARLRELRETRDAAAATRLAQLPALPPKKRTRKLPR